MFQTLKNAWKTPDLKKKIIFTFFILILYRLGASIAVPYVNPDLVGSLTQGSILNFMSLLSGGALANATLFALSVSPYITSSIVMQLLTIAIPPLERMAKDEEGKKKISAITRWVTVALAIVTSIGYMFLLENYGWVTYAGYEGFSKIWARIIIVTCYCAGASLIMWLAEKINEFGIGNGISLILFANIVSRVPSLVVQSLWPMIMGDKVDSNGAVVGNLFSETPWKNTVAGIGLGLLSVALTFAIIVFIVRVTNSERRIPIQYAKSVKGRKMYGGQNTNLPIKVNMTGVMPIIFANSIVAIPATIASFMSVDNKFAIFVNKHFNYNTWTYLIVFLLLNIAFAYFYTLISFNPIEVSNNIRNSGGSVPGIRPGRPTAEYITRILNRITLIGGLFLCLVAGLPMIINIINVMIDETSTTFAGLAFGGSSLLIVVGVALETVREIEAQLALRNSKARGFLG